jgi:hypothetical protein
MSSQTNEDVLVSHLSSQHSVSSDAVRTEWSPGMAMVGDMFNNSLKSKLDSICTELAAYVVQTQSGVLGRDRQTVEASYRAVNRGANWWPAHRGNQVQFHEVQYERPPDPKRRQRRSYDCPH